MFRRCVLCGSGRGIRGSSLRQKGCFTAKSDVYSFGVVLLEIITRKQAIYDNKEDYPQSLKIEYSRALKIGSSGKAMFDEEIAIEGNIFFLEEMGNLAIECLSDDADERPEMGEVLEQLQKLKRDWKNSKGSSSSSDVAKEIAADTDTIP